MDYRIGQRLRLTKHLGYDHTVHEDHPAHPRQALTPPVIPAGTPDAHGVPLPVDTPDGMHQGMHPLFAGQVGEIIHIAPASDTGKDEDTAILEFQHRQFVRHGMTEVAAADGGVAWRPDPDNPEHVEGDHVRHVAYTQAQLDDLFEPEDAP